MKNIVYLINSLRKSGPVNVLMDIIANLDRSKYTPIIIKFKKDNISRSITHQFKELGVYIIELNLSFWELELQTYKVASKIDNILKDLNADLIHTHGYHPVLVSSYLKADLPKIETLHCMCGEDFCNSKGLLVGRYMTWRYTARLKHIDYLVAISQTLKNYYKQILPNKYIDLNYNGSKFNYNKNVDKIQLRTTLGLPLDKKIYVVVGALTQNKDPKTIIRAFNKTNISNSALLIFLGEGPLLKECKEISSGLSIIFKGYVFNVEDYLLAADYSICASKNEGFGLNFIESIICNTPVIGSNIGPFNEFREHYPLLQKLTFEAGNITQLSEIIELTLTQSYDITDISLAFSELYSAKRMSNAYMQIYEKAVTHNFE